MFQRAWTEYQSLFLNRTRIDSYYGLRFFSILAVVVFHLVLEGVKLKILSFDVQYFFQGATAIFFLSMFSGSGQLIFIILMREKEKNGYIKAAHFWLRRILRTWPLYFLVLFVYYFFAEGDRSYFWHYLTFTQNFIVLKSYFFIPSWSLAVEEQFYLLAPILFIVFQKFHPLVTTILLLCVTQAGRYALNINILQSSNTLCWADGFICSYYMAHCFLKQNKFHQVLYEWANAFCIGGVAVFAVLFYNRFRFDSEASLIVFICMCAIIYPIGSTKHFLYQFLSRPIFKFLAAASYAMYLVHDLVISYFYKYFHETFVNQPLIFLLSAVLLTAVIIVIGSLLFLVFEIPIFKLRERILKSPDVRAA